MYKIVTTPNSILTKTAQEVSKFDKKLRLTIDNMKQTLLATSDPIGVGLAAPQVGLSLRIFQMKPTQNSKVTTFINPVILNLSKSEGILKHTGSEKIEASKPKSSKKKLLEGCLSIPNIWGNVTRKKEITIVFQDENGGKKRQTFTGFPAVIIQHEMDHLQGILFTKHVMEQKEKLYKSHKNGEGEDVFDEIKL